MVNFDLKFKEKTLHSLTKFVVCCLKVEARVASSQTETANYCSDS